ncbi:MAG: M67 family metallopeptidase [Deltaproteobacteria bacterium]|jgi:proteasome lid subunit RPN8/RPN11|nr:M67 family metallopeptidase [Deltaproteobacteria bacterium]
MIHLELALRERLVEAARQAYPLEAGGFLLGQQRGEDYFLQAQIPGQGPLSPTGYLLSAEELLAAEATARTWGLLVLGFYHSHPEGPAWPSSVDHDDALPGYLYAIVAPGSEEGSAALAFFGLDETSGLLTIEPFIVQSSDCLDKRS